MLWTAKFVATLAIVGGVHLSPVHNMSSTNWPVQRIIANLEERVASSPEDAGAHYDLGRAHAWAFALRRASLPYPLSGFTVKPSTPGSSDSTPRPEELLEHLEAAIQHLRKAAGLDPKWGYRWLTLAWVLETGSHLADRFDNVELFELQSIPLTGSERKVVGSLVETMCSEKDTEGEAALAALIRPARLEQTVARLGVHRISPIASAQARISRLLTRFWIERSIEYYRKAYELAVEVDVGQRGDTLFLYNKLQELACWEAGWSYLRLVRSRGLHPDEEALASAMEAKLRSLEGLEVHEMITPLLMAIDGCHSLDELTAPSLTVRFDLDGDGVDELWPWLAPSAGWVVWDPEHEGAITSGRQLFGTASAWLFFEDGYRVLDALDDDRDGELRGAELAGISVWFDRDTDGVSDRGEVMPVEELGIVAVRTQATMRIGESPANLCGLEMSDGRVLPTYDWVVRSVASP